jgi:hypothetical protein
VLASSPTKQSAWPTIDGLIEVVAETFKDVVDSTALDAESAELLRTWWSLDERIFGALVSDAVERMSTSDLPVIAAVDGLAFQAILKTYKDTSTPGARRVQITHVDEAIAASLTPSERKCREVVESVRESYRDAHDQTMYIGDYSTKKSKTLESVLARQEVGIARKCAELEAEGCDKKEIAAQKVIKLHTAAKQAGFNAAITQCYTSLYHKESQCSHEPWTLHIRFALWAARAAYAEIYGTIATDPIEEVAADVCAFITNDVEGQETSCSPVADNATATAKLVTTNQKDDYLHRGTDSELGDMGILHYSQVVTRVDMPTKMARESLKHPYYPFAEHYILSFSHAQKFDPLNRPAKLPVIEGGGCPSKAKNAQVNALYKSVLYRPIHCSGTESDGKCHKFEAYGRLCCRTGWVEPWDVWFRVQQQRAAKALKFARHHQVYPSWPTFYTLAAPGAERRTVRWFIAYIT